MQNNTIQLIDDKGNKIEAEILFTYHSDEFNKDYVVFTVDDSDEAVVECYKENENGEGVIYDIESDQEFEMINKLFMEYLENEDEEDWYRFI